MRHPIRTFLSALFLLTAALGAVPAWSADPAPAPEPAAAAPVLGQPVCAALQAVDLAAVLGVAEAPMSPAEPGEAGLSPEPEAQMDPPIRRYCKCGCGIGCTSDADCGEGGSCVAFITCC